ncbi:MAG: IS66 family transposase [Thermoanaerobaculia bacterium]|nr:IS66 family transposase [Thermoanaerobaculia bacterium]
MLEQNAALVERVGRLATQIGHLSDQLARANDRIDELLAALGQKAARRQNTESEQPVEAPSDLSDDVREAFENRPTPPEREEKKKKPPKKREKAGRNKLPDSLPRDTHTLTPSSCDHCGSTDLAVVRQHVEEKLTVVKAHQRVRRTVRDTCDCNACGQRTTPRALPAPFPRSKATCEWLAWFIWARHALLLPMDRIRRDLDGKGVPLAMSYLVSQVERAADILAPIDGEHWKQLLGGDWMGMDATGLKVCVKGVPETHNGNLEAFHNGETVVVQYEATKHSDNLVSKLRPFSGVLVADAEHRHNVLFEDGSIIEAGCNAHGRRKLRDAETAQPKLAADAGRFISAVYNAEAEARKLGLTGEALRDWRRQRCKPHLDDFERWNDAVRPTLLPSDPLTKALAYYSNHWDALCRFVDHPEIPIDNSATERLYQPIAKLRHNILFAGSTEGAHRLATLLGIVATCRALGIDGEAYLAWAFTRLGTHKDLYDLTAAELTPAAYAAAYARDGPGSDTATTG